MKEKYLFSQVFMAVIVVFLGISFYMLAGAGLVLGLHAMITPMILVIIAIILLAMLSEIGKLAECSGKKK